MKNVIYSIVSEFTKVNISDVNDELSTDNCEAWDSLAIINIALAIESEFGISLSAEQIANLTSIKKILTILEEGE